MTKAEIIELLQEWSDHFKDLQDLYSSIDGIFDINSESKFSRCVFGAFESYTKTLALFLESFMDKDEAGVLDWLNWYTWENDNGAREYEAFYDEGVRRIKTVEDLYWTIFEARRGNNA